MLFLLYKNTIYAKSFNYGSSEINLVFFIVSTFPCEYHRHYTIYKPLVTRGLLIKFYIEEI